MVQKSRLFGAFEYREDQVFVFPDGLLGFPDYTRFVLKTYAATLPVRWLLSVDENGPELALVNPVDVSSAQSFGDLPLTRHMREALDSSHDGEDRLQAYAVVTLPENIKQMSMNLRAPILLHPQKRRGIQYESKHLAKKPVRCLIYRDLIFSRPEDKSSLLVIKRKENETIEIGDEISIQVMDIGDGGVRLGVNAPQSIRVSRGEGEVTPRCETIRASDHMDLGRLEGVMGMHRIMRDPENRSLAETALQLKALEETG